MAQSRASWVRGVDGRAPGRLGGGGGQVTRCGGGTGNAAEGDHRCRAYSPAHAPHRIARLPFQVPHVPRPRPAAGTMHACKPLGDGPPSYRDHLSNNVAAVLTHSRAVQTGFEGYLAVMEQMKEHYNLFHKQLLHISNLVGAVNRDFEAMPSAWNALDSIRQLVSSHSTRVMQFLQELQSHIAATVKPARVALHADAKRLQDDLKQLETRRSTGPQGRVLRRDSAGCARVLLNNSTSLSGGGGGPDTPHPPPP